MILEIGEKVHVMIRRRFEGDTRRHFIGEVDMVNDVTVRVTGYIFILDTSLNEYVRKSDKRTRILSLVDAMNIINILPREAEVKKAVYVRDKDRNLVVTDGETFTLNINEFGARQ